MSVGLRPTGGICVRPYEKLVVAGAGSGGDARGRYRGADEIGGGVVN